MPSKKPGPEDPFAALWESEIPEILRRDTSSQVTNAGLLDTLLQQHPTLLDGRKRNHMLRTLGRQVARWSTHNGHEPSRKPSPSAKTHVKSKAIVFRQEHPPGREAQAAFTNTEELRVTIQGDEFPHLLYNFRLSHSGWCCVQVVDDSVPQAVAPCLQHAITRLGVSPSVLRTDHTNAAIQDGEPPATLARLMQHHQMSLSLANRGRPWELGGVRSSNRDVKRAIEQSLIIRGNRDFANQYEYQDFVQSSVDRQNTRHRVQEHLNADLAAMRPPPRR